MNALTPLGTARLPLPEALSRSHVPLAALDLRELRYFAAAARTGNLGRAAQELNVTASAISQQLRKLEDALGTPLLIRHGRGVTPTPIGTRLLERIDAVLRLLAAPLDAECAEAAIGDTISVAIPAELGPILAVPLLEQMQRGWPRVSLALKESANGGAEAELLDGRTDIAVLPDASEMDDLHIARVLTEDLGLVLAPRVALAQSAQPLRLHDLDGVPLILPGQRHWIRRLLTRAAFQRGVLLHAAFQADSVSMTKDMVRNGLGCAVLTRASVREETARGALVFRPIAQPAVTVTHAIAVRHAATPVVREIAAAMAEIVRSLAAGGTWPGAQTVRSPAPMPDMPQENWRLPRPEPVRGIPEFVEGD